MTPAALRTICYGGNELTGAKRLGKKTEAVVVLALGVVLGGILVGLMIFIVRAAAVYHLTQTVLALQKERIPSAPSSRP